ncbi:katanin p80 WD40 repeat-containing subunit B1 homolog KTN80.2-like isoform X2 [Andrographis paniculata]|nr:katanin p80 WD40 repeat-containing subunit B1 homolog KTN80.2-like isoform X2 [Andrographis paniculata]
MDTNLKIWDIRKKGCIHTYKGHTRGISNIRFTPDGRWVVSGGLDNVVKVWDLTAGKLLHDFKFHEGHIRSLEFHPLEFLLASGSADKTVKFWDLETFEMIGSTRREASGIKSLAFHPDGKSIFCGLDDSLKVFSWEPIICHDSVDMGWSSLGDLCIHDGKLLGGAYYENSVALWVADASLIEPYSTRLTTQQSKLECDTQGNLLDKEADHPKLKSNMHSTTPDSDNKDVKTIYVDCVSSVTPKIIDSVDTPKGVCTSDSKESNAIGVHKHSFPPKPSTPVVNKKTLVMPNIVPRDGSNGKHFIGSRRESLGSAKAFIGMPVKPSSARRLSSSRFDMERMAVSHESDTRNNIKTPLRRKMDSGLRNRLITDEFANESSEGKLSNHKIVTEKFDRLSLPSTNNPILDSSKRTNSPRVVNGGAATHRRTPSSVERFAKNDEIQKPERDAGAIAGPPESLPSQSIDKNLVTREGSIVDDSVVIENLMQNHQMTLPALESRLTKLQVVRQFWERNDIKGAINAARKLSDHSVQADFISILMPCGLEIITLDLFYCLLPMLLALLESRTERHIILSLEMLVKLAAVFAPIVHTTVSAPPVVGVDLHAEERIECCKRCFDHLQELRTTLPELMQRGGNVARYAQQLNLVVQM